MTTICPESPHESALRAAAGAAQTLPQMWVVAACLVDVDGRILVAQRPPGKDFAGLWEFPGGKINPGESPESALVRELDEELGLKTHSSCCAPLTFATYFEAQRQIVMLVYVIRKWDGFVVPREGQAVQWLMPRDLLRLPMPPVDVPVAGLIAQLL